MNRRTRQIRTLVFALLGALAALGRASAADPMDFAMDLGTQLGKADFCGFDTDEFFKRSLRAVDARFKDEAKRNEATQVIQAAYAAWAGNGPQKESCAQFRPEYEKSLQALRDAGF